MTSRARRWVQNRPDTGDFGHFDPERRQRERQAERRFRAYLKHRGQRRGGAVKNRLYCPECGAKVDGEPCGFCAALEVVE